MFRFGWSAWVLIAANLVPLVGIFSLEWELGDILILYWSETAIIGMFTILKLVVAALYRALADNANVLGWAARLFALCFMIGFFCVHFGMFMFGHLLALGTLLYGESPTVEFVRSYLQQVWPALVVLIVSHGISFWKNFMGAREYARQEDFFLQPYKRVIVMHLVIIGGSILILVVGAPIALLVLLILAKTFLDLHAHVREHRR